jgi:integration host factor subunit beta
MTKSDLIEALAANQSHLALRAVELAVKGLLERMSSALATGERIEIRAFGSFSLHFRPPRMGRNPKSGDAVALRGKYVPHFKPGKELRERVNQGFQAQLDEEKSTADLDAQESQKTGTDN